MKNIVKTFVVLLFISISLVLANSAAAQFPPPPPGNGHVGGGTQPPGGSAPIGEGLLFLTVLGAAYSGKKWHTTKSRK